ncbi:hypothetical protein COCSADRAFT_166620 [Bipolaris sorokiniana ND90Pr]|uniref:Secreted protein n=1 Tax=Cochliobolus sativus (strain ND90Pr / ATCC 201652) TaxID=665912 RepID=M2T5F4_COCSN|nr:uncharacterized protein COCSADRAFT_166620 [Bipolaris sorokiniana ND90Pr]EMD69645.1 hypothetical protein COCSADRAFT_166620 [Bipolaris sorokiniana ND90Pr]
MALRTNFPLVLFLLSSFLPKIVCKTTKDVVKVTLFLLTLDSGISHVPHQSSRPCIGSSSAIQRTVSPGYKTASLYRKMAL